MIQFSQLLVESQQINLSMKAYKQLSYKAKRAIDEWETSNWVGGQLETSVRNNDEIAQEIERLFAPVRAAIPGNTIKLYRGMQNTDTDDHKTWQGKKLLYSWTDDRRVAAHFAGWSSWGGNNGNWKSRITTPYTDQQINDFVVKYERTGYVKVGRYQYVRNKQHPKYYNIYRDNQLVTDGDNLFNSLKSDQEWAVENNQKLLSNSTVLEKTINKDDIIWLTNNLKSKEYIVKQSGT